MQGRNPTFVLREGLQKSLSEAIAKSEVADALNLRFSDHAMVYGSRSQAALDAICSLGRGDELHLFYIVTDPSHSATIGQELAAIICFDTPGGTSHAVQTTASQPETLALQPPFPVDIVYSWVDGSDASWQAKMRSFDPGATNRTESARPVAHQFGSGDELRYSLRSLAQNVPWYRNIYVVTDGQHPVWLREDDRLQVVDHREIFADPGALPVFNSHAIEANLHRISGLAENYLYVNDDVFFGGLALWTDFFTPSGTTKFTESLAEVPEVLADNSTLADRCGFSGRSLLLRHFDDVPPNKIKHIPHPQLRALHREMDEKFPGVYADVSRSRFRSGTDVSVAAYLHHRYGALTGRAATAEFSYEYVSIDRPNLAAVLRRTEKNPGVWCLNDAEMTTMQRRAAAQTVSDFLQRCFPYPSQWEDATKV